MRKVQDENLSTKLDEITDMTRSMGTSVFGCLPAASLHAAESCLRSSSFTTRTVRLRNCRHADKCVRVTRKVVTDVEKFWRGAPTLRFGLDISRDGIGEDHDTIRAQKDCSRSVIALTGD